MGRANAYLCTGMHRRARCSIRAPVVRQERVENVDCEWLVDPISERGIVILHNNEEKIKFSRALHMRTGLEINS